VGTKPSHSDDGGFGSEVGDVVPFVRDVSFVMSGKMSLLGDNIGVDRIVSVVGVDRDGEGSSRDVMILNEG
jgi:hypothetical protein